MSHFNKPAQLFFTSAVFGVLLLPIAAQAHGKATKADKAVDATTLPVRKTLHFSKKTGESAERHIGHVGKQIF